MVNCIKVKEKAKRILEEALNDLSDWDSKGRWVGNYLKPHTSEEWSRGDQT